MTFEQAPTPEKPPRDISQEFLSMGVHFGSFLDSLDAEASLSISIDWKDWETAVALKAFLEGGPDDQKRSATIRATRTQAGQAQNVFASGVKWIEVAE